MPAWIKGTVVFAFIAAAAWLTLACTLLVGLLTGDAELTEVSEKWMWVVAVVSIPFVICLIVTVIRVSLPGTEVD